MVPRVLRSEGGLNMELRPRQCRKYRAKSVCSGGRHASQTWTDANHRCHPREFTGLALFETHQSLEKLYWQLSDERAEVYVSGAIPEECTAHSIVVSGVVAVDTVNVAGRTVRCR